MSEQTQTPDQPVTTPESGPVEPATATATVEPPQQAQPEPLRQDPPAPEPPAEAANSNDTTPVIETDIKSEATQTAELIAPKKAMHIFGKSPENGGEEGEWLQLFQRPLSTLNSMVFFGMFADALLNAMESGASQLDDILGNFNIRGSKGFNLNNIDDMGEWLLVLLRLVKVAPNFVADSFVMWLEVPADKERWFRQIIFMRYDPEEEEWGPTQDKIIELFEIFLEQNYDEVRSFFTEKLPKVAAKASLLEERRQARVSASDQSKPSKH